VQFNVQLPAAAHFAQQHLLRFSLIVDSRVVISAVPAADFLDVITHVGVLAIVGILVVGG
jgi:hypothetical protein